MRWSDYVKPSPPVVWLDRPMDQTAIDARRQIWERQHGAWMIVTMGSMVVMIVLAVLDHPSLPRQGLDLMAMRGLFGLLVITSIVPALLAATDPLQMSDFYPIDDGQAAEARWWLERVPAASHLREHLQAQPRRLCRGEFRMLCAAGRG